MLRVGLNPYGLTYTLGLQGLGTPRANPRPAGLAGFLRSAREIQARTLELDGQWLTPMPETDLRALGAAAAADGMAVVCSFGLAHTPGETLDDAVRIARVMEARLIRLHLTPVLEGARALLGSRWAEMVARVERTLVDEAPKAADAGLLVGIENHQDFCSDELLALADAAGENVGVVLDTGNPFAVGEDPVAFAPRVADRVIHVHLKDYRAQFTADGYRLVRCALGDGCVPLREMVGLLNASRETTASIEVGALEARHIRLFTSEWWTGYPTRDAEELGTAINRLRHNELDAADDYRTPWEREAPATELVAYEVSQLHRSVEHLRGLGWMWRCRA